MTKQGVEPWTFALLARRSNQLSYSANWLVLEIQDMLNILKKGGDTFLKLSVPGEARTHNLGISHLYCYYKYRALTDCATGTCLSFLLKSDDVCTGAMLLLKLNMPFYVFPLAFVAQ